MLPELDELLSGLRHLRRRAARGDLAWIDQRFLDGRLEWREWDAKDGTKRQSVDIVADTVQFLGSRGDNGGGQQASDQGFATTSDVPGDTDFPDADPVGAHAGGGGGDDDIPF